MVAAIAARYEDDTDDPIATVTAVAIEATGLTVNETQTSDNIEDEVAADPITYYLTAEKAGSDDLVSPRFQGAAFTWDNVIFPDNGTWAMHVRKDEDDSSVVSANLDVAEPD